MDDLGFPEVAVGGFARRDGTVQFYTRVRSLCRPESVVCDLGAGRGEWMEDEVVFRRGLRFLRGDVSSVIGVDVDEAVQQNPSLTESRIMANLVDIPLGDDSVDVLIADHTFEHVERPEELAESMHRVVRPGGWVCARTPNRWGYIGVATNLVPNRWHRKVLRRAQPERKAEDVFPTVYALNTRSAVRSTFRPDRWEVFMLPFNPPPAYFGRNARLVKFVDSIQTRLPSGMGSTWHVFARKK